MQNTKNKIYFNFSYEILKLLGDGLYSNPWTAISELIANGIDADATKIYLYINMINKQSSTIEIFDNGYGMSYDDLAEKYVLIGKNKRIDKDLDDIQKDHVMGRKGIGKLAALYLSSKFYLTSKTIKGDSSWCFDMNDSKNENIPNLRRTNELIVESKKYWQSCKTGTLLKLINVDLRNIGEQTFAGIKARIADYYSFNDKSIDFLISLKQNSKDNIVFERAEKQIAYKNFYAFFDNSNMNFKKMLQSEVLLKTNFPEEMPNTKKVVEAAKEVYYKKCPIKLLNNVFTTSGNQKFIDDSGKLSVKSYGYELIGWIGVHSTIEKNDAKLNDNVFIRNKAYKPNRLRLYVRNKLAVENFMEYLHNTQTFAKYIEGEIHFDVLDHNDLPDIATADRQDYKEENDRIQELIKILNPIINSLIKARIGIGHQIRIEEEEYRKAKEAEQYRKTEKAENEAKTARAAQDKAEKHAKKVEKDLEQEKKQAIFQRSIIGREKEQIMGLQHHIKLSASRIKTNVSFLYDYLNVNFNTSADKNVIKPLSTISIAGENILSIAKYVTNANYNLKASEINEDVIQFIQEYINEVFIILEKKYPKIEIVNNERLVHLIEFRPLEITNIIDNLIHNAKNAKAKNVTFSFLKRNNRLELNITDDGIGIKQQDIKKIFDFGYSSTDGSGIGLYMVKKAIENLKGRIEVVSEKNKGTIFKITI